ncbi:MAG: DNA protecting protein DprA [Actinobacteria bacterium 13_2_20CM_2_71_6]|nr:MAG: DNA protecting protein DprA [Actinobacteria bacterium 13_2_20CM_2_71_6]
MSMDEIRAARVALACLVEPGSADVHQLVAEYGPVDALDALVSGQVPEQVAGAVRARLADGDVRRVADQALARTDRLGARLVIPEDAEWPEQLADLRRISRPGGARVDRDTYDPVCLWVRGAPPLTQALHQSVSIVGARASTSYGNHVATELGYGLANRDWAVVSGGAYGIDAAAHRGALAAGGITVAVLACGVDRAYPLAHASLFERIIEDGLLVSEWPPGADPHRHRFLIRNRVIAALSRGTVVVEASARSGARQTFGRALLLGRAAMAVPGPVTSAMSVGCHALLRYGGARPVMSYAEVLEEVGRIGDDLAPVPRGPEEARDRLGPELCRVLDGVPLRGVADPGQIAAAAGVPLRDALRALPVLESSGFVVARDGGYAAISRPVSRTTDGVPA